MENIVHPNFIKASNFMFGSVILGIFNLFLVPEIFTDGRAIVVATSTLLFLAFVSYATRLGKYWTKVLLLFLMIVGLLAMPTILSNLKSNTLLGISNLIQTVLQLSALIFLFQVPKKSNREI